MTKLWMQSSITMLKTYLPVSAHWLAGHCSHALLLHKVVISSKQKKQLTDTVSSRWTEWSNKQMNRHIFHSRKRQNFCPWCLVFPGPSMGEPLCLNKERNHKTIKHFFESVEHQHSRTEYGDKYETLHSSESKMEAFSSRRAKHLTNTQSRSGSS